MAYRNKINDCIKNKAGTVSSCNLIKLKEANYSKVYDNKMNVFKSIHPIGKSKDHHNASNLSQSTKNLKKQITVTDEIIGSWAQVIQDPNLAIDANKKMWEKFGYGIDWENIHKCKQNRSTIMKSMDAKAKYTKQQLAKLSRNWEGDVNGLPLLSQRTLKDIRDPNLSLKAKDFFASTCEEKEE